VTRNFLSNPNHPVVPTPNDSIALRVDGEAAS
jgi:hypothetical protein